eukprot:1195971-Prorocentrum_minimum.AAC.6
MQVRAAVDNPVPYERGHQRLVQRGDVRRRVEGGPERGLAHPCGPRARRQRRGHHHAAAAAGHQAAQRALAAGLRGDSRRQRAGGLSYGQPRTMSRDHASATARVDEASRGYQIQGVRDARERLGQQESKVVLNECAGESRIPKLGTEY